MAQVNVNPGDGIYVNVSYETANNQANFYVEDTSNGSHSALPPISLGNNSYDGSSTEWIVERSSTLSGVTNLANFGQYDWTDANSERDDASWISLGNAQTNFKATMTATASRGVTCWRTQETSRQIRPSPISMTTAARR